MLETTDRMMHHVGRMCKQHCIRGVRNQTLACAFKNIVTDNNISMLVVKKGQNMSMNSIKDGKIISNRGGWIMF